MRASTRIEEEVGELQAEVERLRWEVVRHRERAKKAEARKAEAGADAASWRRKILALTGHHEKRIRQITQWAERLSRERSALERERRLLSERVSHLTEERETLLRSLSRFRREALEQPVPDSFSTSSR